MSDVTPAEKAAEALEAVKDYLRTRDEALGTPDANDEERAQSASDILAALRSPADAQTPVGVEAELIEKLRVAANGIGSLKSERGDYGLLDDAADALARVMGERDEALELARAGFHEKHATLYARAEAAEKETAALRECVVELRADQKALLRSVLFHFGPEGARTVTSDALDARAALTQGGTDGR